MSLTIEDGSIVAGADSYATTADLAAYAVAFGRTIPAGDPAREALLRRAALQMDAMAWKGTTVSEAQSLVWPRECVVRNGFTIPSNTIPEKIKSGQMALATEIYADDLAPPELKKGAVVRNKVDGAVEQEYAKLSTNQSRAAAMRQSMAMFTDYLCGSSTTGRLVRS